MLVFSTPFVMVDWTTVRKPIHEKSAWCCTSYHGIDTDHIVVKRNTTFVLYPTWAIDCLETTFRPGRSRILLLVRRSREEWTGSGKNRQPNAWYNHLRQVWKHNLKCAQKLATSWHQSKYDNQFDPQRIDLLFQIFDITMLMGWWAQIWKTGNTGMPQLSQSIVALRVFGHCCFGNLVWEGEGNYCRNGTRPGIYRYKFWYYPVLDYARIHSTSYDLKSPLLKFTTISTYEGRLNLMALSSGEVLPRLWTTSSLQSWEFLLRSHSKSPWTSECLLGVHFVSRSTVHSAVFKLE
jgi:hypothetical protein